MPAIEDAQYVMTVSCIQDRQTAIVVGGAGGIGRAICQLLAASRMRVLLLDLNHTAGHKVVDGLPGDEHSFVPVDVTSQTSVEAAFDQAEAHAPASRLVIVSGGPIGTPTRPSDILNIDLDEWDRTFALNTTGTFLCLRKFARQRVKRPVGRTRVVLFSSITGQIGGAVTGVAYPASKAAVMGLTRQAALDLAPHDILVNAVSPGSVETEEFKRFVDAPMIAALQARSPLRRISTPEEIAHVVAFLLSDACSYMTGTTIDVNGGALMR